MKALHCALAGDFGDKDLEMALQQAGERKRDIALVTFGHMHQALQPRWDIDTRTKEGGQRNMADINEESGELGLHWNQERHNAPQHKAIIRKSIPARQQDSSLFLSLACEA